MTFSIGGHDAIVRIEEKGTELYYCEDCENRFAHRGMLTGTNCPPEVGEGRYFKIYTAGCMDRNGDWRRDAFQKGIREKDGFTAEFIHPDAIAPEHGGQICSGVVEEDMEALKKADVVFAYFNRKCQHGTTVEVVNSATKGKKTIAVFHPDLLPSSITSTPIKVKGDSYIEMPGSSEYWFLFNFLTGDESYSSSSIPWFNGTRTSVYVAEEGELADVFAHWENDYY